MFGRGLAIATAVALVAIASSSAAAQDAAELVDHQQHVDAAPDGWTFTTAARAFSGFNGQDRKFRNFTAWEAQNWVMAEGSRPIGGGTVDLLGMVSLEPFTLHKIGSPQVFQTGEMYRGAPLIDYQHPHDLLMGAGGSYRRPIGSFTVTGGADLVGSPTLGPTAYMLRASAAHNPQAPLSHHYLDSNHITPGVVRAGLGTRGLTIEASTFHGREPDERRTDLDLGKLDSYAVRVGWTRGAWRAQASGAQLTLPEAVTPYDARRLTASIEYTGAATGRIRAMTAAFGQNREIHGNFEAYLFEAELSAWRSDVFYTRVESVATSPDTSCRPISKTRMGGRGHFTRSSGMRSRPGSVGTFTDAPPG